MGPEHRFSRRTRVALLLLLAGMLLGLPWLVAPVYRPFQDSSIYLITAQNLLAGEGYTYLGEPFILRPPGFSALLVPVLLFEPSFAVLNLYVSLYGVAAVALLFVYLVPRLGDELAFAVAVAVWLNPLFQKLCNQPKSDVPGLVVMLVCLLVERWGRRRPGFRRDLVLGLCLGASIYVRSVFVLLVPAIVLVRAWRVGQWRGFPWWDFVRREALVVVAVPLLVFGPWQLRNHLSPPTAPAEQTLNYSYGSAMWHEDRGDPSSPRVSLQEFAGRAPDLLPRLTSLLGSRLQSGQYNFGSFLLGVGGLMCLLVVLLRRREPGELFGFSVLFLLAFLHNFESRLSLPVYVLLLPAVVECFALLVRRGFRIPGSWPVMILVLALAAWDSRSIEQKNERHLRFTNVADAMCSGLDESDVIATSDEAPHLSVYLERPVFSVRHVLRRDGLPGALELLLRHRVDVVLVEESEPRMRELLDWLETTYGPGERLEGFRIVRIDDRRQLRRQLRRKE